MVSSQGRIFEEIVDHIQLKEHAVATDLLAIVRQQERETQALAQKQEQEKIDLWRQHDNQIESYRKSLLKLVTSSSRSVRQFTFTRAGSLPDREMRVDEPTVRPIFIPNVFLSMAWCRTNFSHLPAEIRLQIYGCLFEGSCPLIIDRNDHWRSRPQPDWNQPSPPARSHPRVFSEHSHDLHARSRIRSLGLSAVYTA